MRVECYYGEIKMDPDREYRGGYAFEVPDGTKVGDVLDDGGQSMTVVRIGSDYTGRVRRLGERPISPLAQFVR